LRQAVRTGHVEAVDPSSGTARMSIELDAEQLEALCLLGTEDEEPNGDGWFDHAG
jgi:hypothetical protein